jgi:hypothetical protein
VLHLDRVDRVQPEFRAAGDQGLQGRCHGKLLLEVISKRVGGALLPRRSTRRAGQECPAYRS